mgnify:CR=1 FL=1
MRTSLSRVLFSGILITLSGVGLSSCSSFPGQGTELSRKQIEQGARQGDAESQYRLGLVYTNDARPDHKQATMWFRRSADQGNRDAQYMLGINYLAGKGVERDLSSARIWFQQAADQGQANAQYQLGEIYINGRGVPVEQDWAARWYGKAAEQQHTEAQFSLGVAFARGLGLPINWVRACQWLLLAEKSEHALAPALREKVCGELSAAKWERAQRLADRWKPTRRTFYKDPPTVRYIQMKLQQLRFYSGYIDGVYGDQTREALERYQAGLGEDLIPELNEGLLERLRKG